MKFVDDDDDDDECQCFVMNMLVLRSFMSMDDLWAFRYSS